MLNNKKKTIIDRRFQAIFNNRDFYNEGEINEFGKDNQNYHNEIYHRFYKLKENRLRSKKKIEKKKHKKLNINDFLQESTDEYHDLWSDGENKEQLVEKPFENELILNGSSFKR